MVFLPQLKDQIMAGKDGKVIIQPDSSNPEHILLGNPAGSHDDSPQFRGILQILDEIFGSSLNSKGWKVFNPSIGVIYCDGMYCDRVERILQGCIKVGFVTSNIVLGCGGILLQDHQQDDLGFAFKATAVTIDGEVTAATVAASRRSASSSQRRTLLASTASLRNAFCFSCSARASSRLAFASSMRALMVSLRLSKAPCCYSFSIVSCIPNCICILNFSVTNTFLRCTRIIDVSFHHYYQHQFHTCACHDLILVVRKVAEEVDLYAWECEALVPSYEQNPLLSHPSQGFSQKPDTPHPAPPRHSGFDLHVRSCHSRRP